MEPSFEQKVRDVIAKPRNLGEMADADAVGSAGSAGCGDLLRVWIKFREQDGGRVVDRASFQSFGCETAIAMASLATELIQGKTVNEALALKGEDFAMDLGPLPPMKVHCGALVEAAFREALAGESRPPAATPTAALPSPTPSLSDSFQSGNRPATGRRIVLLNPPG